MSAVTATIGITSFTSGLVTKVSTSRKVETKVIKNYAGEFGAAATFDPTGEFTVEGQGDFPDISVGVASSHPSTISGGTIIIDSVSQSQKSDDFQSWKYSGKHYPGAS